MQHCSTLFILLVLLGACNAGTATKVNKPISQTKECKPGKDTINIFTEFSKDTVKAPTERFYAVVKFVTAKGLFKPPVDKTGKLAIGKENSKTFPVAYDSCDMKRWITKNFIMSNIQVSKLIFKATKKDKYSGFTPMLRLEEWKFANNADLDSAMNIVQAVYTYPTSSDMYEKRYSQFIIDDKRIFLLETGAKFAEPYAIEYKKLIKNFIATIYDHQ
jgi:hypothetical protein